MTVVIAGCGDLGTETGLRFAAVGHRVMGLRRSIGKLPPEIEGQSVDLSTEVPTLPADTSIVMIAMSPDVRSVDGYRAAYVDSVRNIATAIRRDCTVPPRVVYVSSTAVYGVVDGSWVDESTAAEPTASTAVVLREAEDLVLNKIPDATILRLAGIYGPGRTRQIDRIRDGVETISFEPRFTNLIHRDDAAAAIVHLTTMNDRPATIYIGVDDCPADQREIVEFLARKLDRPVPQVGPGPGSTSSGSATSGSGLGHGKRCHNTRLRESGFEFAYPSYREGYAAVLEGVGVRHS
ncbi:SDR family NAD(P)-dependent oxidoreductase [Rhodoglobus aureus]|uniref:SDR family oxidoreductase n=1 Tax=Rhodoglobus aureus TaxID=191497 RepID=A0ABN1VET3_9MICO